MNRVFGGSVCDGSAFAHTAGVIAAGATTGVDL